MRVSVIMVVIRPCQAVTEWFDHEKVDIDKYPVKYHRALITQNNIGWRHIFMGRISQEWLKIQGSNMTTNGTRREAYIWGASVVEVSITSFIELWEHTANVLQNWTHYPPK